MNSSDIVSDKYKEEEYQQEIQSLAVLLITVNKPTEARNVDMTEDENKTPGSSVKLTVFDSETNRQLSVKGLDNVLKQQSLRPEDIVLFSSFYLGEGMLLLMRDILAMLSEDKLGFSVLSTENPADLEEMVKKAKIDVAFEWQHGPEDYAVCDMIKKYKKNALIFLYLNWNNKLPPDFGNLGYTDYLAIAPTVEELKTKVLPLLLKNRKSYL